MHQNIDETATTSTPPIKLNGITSETTTNVASTQHQKHQSPIVFNNNVEQTLNGKINFTV